MKAFIGFLKNRIVISLIGLLALSLIVWFAGPAIKFGEENAAPLADGIPRLVVILILVALWGLNNLRIQWVSKKQNEGLIDDLESTQENAFVDAALEQSAEEKLLIKQRFSEALATLKKLKFKHGGYNKALYELPWYILIGPPGSGKTTALVNSSLDFPLAARFGKEAFQGIGGTRNCDWWFTNEAVLIDTAGRYTTQDSHKVVDSAAWEGFLDLLKKNRRRRPINGAIVSISIHDLLLQTEEERSQHARTIRTRIDELMEKLEIRFPVYLMFTKADLVSGFTEYFEDLGKEEREQVWGVSLPNAPEPSQSPDFEYLEVEYEKLLKRLYSRELSRMHNERDALRRAAIQGFPQQFENLKSVINSFVKQAFIKNRYQFQPYLRGIYFTSGTQDGTPIDRMMTAVSSSFGFARDNMELQQGQGKSYFLGNLFREVVFPESELVGSNRRYEIFIKWAQRSAYAAMTLSGIVLVMVWAGSVTRHNAYMSEVDSYIEEFNTENKKLKAWNKDVRVVLPTLNALAKSSIVYDQQEHPWLSGMGLYDGSVDTAAGEAYGAQLKELLLPRIIHYLEMQIAKGHQGGDLYNSFRVYLMFNKLEHMDRQLVRDWFTTSWNSTMQGEATRRKELEIHLDALLELDLKPYSLNENIVSRTRELLLRVPVHQRVYSRVKTNPQFNQKIDVLNLFGESVRETYAMAPDNKRALQVPYMYTREGYESIDLTEKSTVISGIVHDRWVLSDDDSARVDFVEDDLGEVGEKVKALYMADYAAQWTKLHNALDIADFSSLQHAVEVLASFTDPVDSPLRSILMVTAENTQLSTPLFQNIDDDHGDGRAGTATNLLADKFKGTKVDQQFRDMNVLLRESGKKPAPVDTIVQKLQELQDFIDEISVAPDPNKKSFEVAKARYTSGSGNAITSLQRYSKNTPDPVKRWLLSISDESWKVILLSARRHVNAEWQARVYRECNRALSGRYPLARNSRDEIALDEFTDFFKPAGVMDKFYTGFIKPFMSRDGWSNRTVDNRSLGLNASTLKQVRRAQDIKKVFFRKNPAAPGISFKLKPDHFEKPDVSFLLEVAGQPPITYSHGPKFWKDVHWSGEEESNRVRTVFVDENENRHEKSFDGPWAWFKLQDHSKLVKTRQSNVYRVTFEVADQGSDGGKGIHRIEYLLKARSVVNPFGQNLLGAFRCPGSI